MPHIKKKPGVIAINLDASSSNERFVILIQSDVIDHHGTKCWVCLSKDRGRISLRDKRLVAILEIDDMQEISLPWPPLWEKYKVRILDVVSAHLIQCMAHLQCLRKFESSLPNTLEP